MGIKDIYRRNKSGEMQMGKMAMNGIFVGQLGKWIKENINNEESW